ncbi:MAG TPA: c-type cytochrome [Gemmatimonadales bacterium]|nr:c-type cytochrome [Gemmatimonadales bacterium]
MRWVPVFVGALLTGLPACRIEQRPPPAGRDGAFRTPAESEIPSGPLGLSIRRGRALLRHTPDSLPQHAPSALRCFSCHMREGTKAGGLPLVGVYSRFPEYRPRNGLINLLEDRINDCFRRSLNGSALPRDGRDMRDLIAYFAFISRGIAPPGEVAGQGLPVLEPLPPDTGSGRVLYREVCGRCHGADGDGTGLAPPLWGPRSFNVGAGMARLYTAASFIRHNMPNDQVVVLTDQQAFDVAGYVLARPRPDFPGKADDWPGGDPPPDVAYPTSAARQRKPAPSPPLPLPRPNPGGLP